MIPSKLGLCFAAVLIAGGSLYMQRAGGSESDAPTNPQLRIAPLVRLAQVQLKPLQGDEVNLLGADQGGQALIVPNDGWLKTITGKAGDYVNVSRGQSAVFAFRDEQPATFWKFAVLIIEQDGNNVKQIELLAGQDSPTGKFESVAKLDIVNAKMVKFPYQEVSFAKTTAKYVEITILDSYGGYNPFLRQIRLTGSPLQ